MNSRHAFYGASVLTMVLASVMRELAREAPFELKLIFGLAVIFTAAYAMRDHLYDERTTYFDVDQNGAGLEKEELIIFGHRTEDLAQESKERRLLMGLTELKGRRYWVYIGWILSVVLIGVLHSRFHAISMLDIGVSFLYISSLFFAPFLHQLLVPLFLSFFFGLSTFVRTDQASVNVFFFAMLGSFCLALVLFREIFVDRVNTKRELAIPPSLKSMAAVVLLLLVIYGITDYLLPEQNPFRTAASPTPLNNSSKLSAEKLSREIAEQVLKWQERKPGDNDRDSGTDPSDSDGKSQRGRGEADRSQANDGDRSEALERGDSSGDSRPGTASPGSGRTQSGDTPGGGANQEISEGSKTQTSDSKSPPSSQVSDDTPATANAKGEGAPKTSGPSGGDGDEKNGGESRRLGDHAGEGKPPGTTASPGFKAAGKSKTRKQQLDELQQRIKLPIELTKGVLFLLIVALGVFVVLRFFSNAKENPAKDIRLQQLSPRQKQKLQMILRQIQARGLAPEEEVVETYNALLAVFEMGHHPREDWFPAEDFSNRVSKAIPMLSVPFAGATNRFSRTLYGRKPVDGEALQQFRDHVAKILRFFQMT